jgi:hypothetical protein
MRLNAFEPADGLPLHPRTVRVGDCERQQDHRRRRYGPLFFRITLISPDSYTHNGTSPTHAIAATCHLMDRVKR